MMARTAEARLLGATLAVYRAAQRLQGDAFAAHVFAWLGTHLAFEQAVILLGR